MKKLVVLLAILLFISCGTREEKKYKDSYVCSCEEKQKVEKVVLSYKGDSPDDNRNRAIRTLCHLESIPYIYSYSGGGMGFTNRDVDYTEVKLDSCETIMELEMVW